MEPQTKQMPQLSTSQPTNSPQTWQMLKALTIVGTAQGVFMSCVDPDLSPLHGDEGLQDCQSGEQDWKVRHPPQLVKQQTGNQKGQDNALRFTVCYYEVIHHWNCGSEDWAKYHMSSTEALSPMLFWLLWNIWKQFFRALEWSSSVEITRKSEDSALADRDRHCVSAQTDFSWKEVTGTWRGRIWNHASSPTHMQEALVQRSLDL